MSDSESLQSGEAKTWSLDFQWVVRVLYKRKWIALLFFVTVVTVVALYTKHQEPVYEATTAVLIERKPPRVLTGTAEVVELGNSNYWSNKEYYQTQYNIIQSRKISGRVVQRLGLLYNTHFLASVGYRPERKETVGELSQDRAAELLAGRIEVNPLKDSMIVNISIMDKDPAFAAELVNAIAQAYRDYNLDHRQDAVRAADLELERLVDESLVKKELAEKAVIDFEASEHVGTISNERRVTDQAILKGEEDLEEVRRRRDAAEANLTVIKKMRKQDSLFDLALPEAMSSSFIVQLKTDYLELESELAELKTSYLEKHPAVLAVQGRMDVLREKGRKESNNFLRAARMELKRVELEEVQLAERVQSRRAADLALADRQLQYDRLVAVREEAREAFEKVNRRLAETKMTGQIRVNNVDILDLARVPRDPAKPNVKLNLVLGILLGLLGGIAAACAVEFMDNTIKSREDIEKVVGATFLGVVPAVRSERKVEDGTADYNGPLELLVHHRPMSTVAEFSRSIRTNLMFVAPDRPLKTLLVTSPNPKEGKTTIAINIGINMAASTGRAVVVDTDMRRPRLHDPFGDRPAQGLSNYLISDDPVTKFICRTEVEQLDLLPCGPCPPNPAELIHTQRFQMLIEELGQCYDTVIFDSPPVNYVTDAMIIGNFVDGVVLVAKFGKTTRDQLRHAKRELETVNARLLGCVINDLDLESQSYGYYNYSQSRYGYGYREGGDAA